jgi:hypothetical protein
MKIIGLSGRKSSGKDTVAGFFVESERFTKLSLATPLKQMLSKVFDIEMKYFEDEKLKEQELPRFIKLDYHHINKIERIVAEDWGFTVDYLAQHSFIDFLGKEIKTARSLMQTVGTDMLRTFIRDDIFIVLLFSRIKELSSNVVVADVRLKNEREALKKAGASLILIKRDSLDNKDKHISENDLGKDTEYDAVINNSDISLGQLRSEVLMWYSVAGAKYE